MTINLLKKVKVYLGVDEETNKIEKLRQQENDEYFKKVREEYANAKLIRDLEEEASKQIDIRLRWKYGSLAIEYRYKQHDKWSEWFIAKTIVED